MEKILRRVNAKERFPEKEGCYISILSDGRIYNVKYPEQNAVVFKEGKILTLNTPIEYWYEEVSTDELEDYKVAVGNLQMIIEMDALKSKERYEKALSILDDYILQKLEEYNYDKTFKHALKIASGLDEI